MSDESPAPPRSRRGRIELATAGMFVVLIAGAVALFPVLRDRMLETARQTVDQVLPAQWAAYYLEMDRADPRSKADPEAADSQLMFASGSFPGKGARLLEAPVYSGSWSPNGERFVATSGSRVFLADRDGKVRQLTDLRDLLPTGPPLWNGDNELFIGATRTGQQQWIVTLDSRTGTVLDQRDIGIGVQPYAASPDGKWILALDHRTGTGILVEIATGKRLTPPERQAFAAWLPDGRIVMVVELERGSRVTARRPDGDNAETLLELDGLPLLPAESRAGRVALVEGANADGSGSRSIWLLSPGQEPVRIAKGLGRVYAPKPSHDGKYVGFSEVSGPPLAVRTGLIEVGTGRVTWACEDGCAVLDVR